jgi:hypothetical protein
MTDFMKRHGISLPETPIRIRNVATEELRSVVWSYAMQSGMTRINIAGNLRSIVPCDDYEAEYPVRSMELAWERCEWPYVFRGIEHIAAILSHDSHLRLATFEHHLNDFFRRKGYAWKLVGGLVEVRGPEAVEAAISKARETLAANGLRMAESELHEALKDLSRRPEPDVTGAIQHAGAALECVAKEVSGKRKKNFGQIISDNPNLFPQPLNTAAEKIWGFVSNNGRHVNEGTIPRHDIAYLVTGFAAALSAYLADKREPGS